MLWRKPIALMTMALLMHVSAASAGMAVDTTSTVTTPDLTSVRAKIEAKDWPAALAELKPLVAAGDYADVYNLYAYALRNTGDTSQALTYYQKALDFDPDHKGAREYLGELYITLGDMPKAQAQRDKLVALCPAGCEERSELEAALATAKPAQ